MGTGKSAVGKVVAERLRRELIEMDAVIERREGVSIGEIFRTKGEPHFRQLERALVRELCGKSGLVISTGGGVVIDAANIEDFRKTGISFSLTAEPSTVYARTKDSTHRPLLKTEDPVKRIVELLEARRPFYEKADHLIRTDDKPVAAVAEEIIRIFSDECTKRYTERL